MVVSVCEEVCARANEPMSKMRPYVLCLVDADVTVAEGLDRDAKMESSDLQTFSSADRPVQILVSENPARPWPFEMDPYPPEKAWTNKQDIIVMEKDIMQQALSIRYRVCIVLPDQSFLHQIGNASDTFMLPTWKTDLPYAHMAHSSVTEIEATERSRPKYTGFLTIFNNIGDYSRSPSNYGSDHNDLFNQYKYEYPRHHAVEDMQ